MLRILFAVFGLNLSLVAAGPVRSGRATAEWLAESHSVVGGQTLRTAIRIVIDPHWHTYWLNPGEAGMPTSAKWNLPDGWTAGEFSHPVPKSFFTGQLAGYGHEGTVVFPVELRAPEGFEGDTTLTVNVSWLTCQDDACIPGDAALTLRIHARAPSSPTAEAPVIARAFEAKPVFVTDGVTLTVKEDKEHVILTATGKTPVELADTTVYARSPEVLDPKAKVIFKKSAGSWQARVAKSPYAVSPITGLELLCIPPKPHNAFILSQ